MAQWHRSHTGPELYTQTESLVLVKEMRCGTHSFFRGRNMNNQHFSRTRTACVRGRVWDLPVPLPTLTRAEHYTRSKFLVTRLQKVDAREAASLPASARSALAENMRYRHQKNSRKTPTGQSVDGKKRPTSYDCRRDSFLLCGRRTARSWFKVRILIYRI